MNTSQEKVDLAAGAVGKAIDRWAATLTELEYAVFLTSLKFDVQTRIDAENEFRRNKI